MLQNREQITLLIPFHVRTDWYISYVSNDFKGFKNTIIYRSIIANLITLPLASFLIRMFFRYFRNHIRERSQTSLCGALVITMGFSACWYLVAFKTVQGHHQLILSAVINRKLH